MSVFPENSIPVSKVVVHPLVLLSVVDHSTRLFKSGIKKRVVGVLLGSWRSKGILDVSNSFAVPFDEDDRDPKVWFVDHDYLENKYQMFKKVNAREKIVGWYHSGPKLHQNDIAINDLVRRYCSNSVLVIIDTEASNVGLPTEAYYSVEEVHDDGTPTSKTFEHVASEIGAEEAEEVGVEHLLRDIKDTVYGSLGERLTSQVLGLRGLYQHLTHVRDYLQQVLDGTLPVNHAIVYELQDMFNLLPDVSNAGLVKSLSVKTNDQMLVVYLASLVRSVIALHNLINNKLANTDAEKKEGSSDSKKDADKKDLSKKEKDAKEEEKEKGEKEKPEKETASGSSGGGSSKKDKK